MVAAVALARWTAPALWSWVHRQLPRALLQSRPSQRYLHVKMEKFAEEDECCLIKKPTVSELMSELMSELNPCKQAIKERRRKAQLFTCTGH